MKSSFSTFLAVTIFIFAQMSVFASPYSTRAKNCEHIDVKNAVIEIFKQKNTYYKAINKSTISSIQLIYPVATFYDLTIDKYRCTGTILMKANPPGFKPTSYEFSNDYYGIAHYYGASDAPLKGYDTYEFDIEYTSQISEGRLLVRFPRYYENIYPQFSCQGSCGGITDIGNIQRKQEQQKKIQQAQEIQTRNKVLAFPD